MKSKLNSSPFPIEKTSSVIFSLYQVGHIEQRHEQLSELICVPSNTIIVIQTPYFILEYAMEKATQRSAPSMKPLRNLFMELSQGSTETLGTCTWIL